MNFKDHFSTISENYQRFRPIYPDELFYHLSCICSEHNCAWDCATGTGQTAHFLNTYFKKVIATDASEKQIQAALRTKKGPHFKVALAEQSGLPDQSIDLITVSQALHWFDLATFGDEVQRVLKPNGILAIWCYGLLSIDEGIDAILNHFYHHTVSPYWSFERTDIENGYRDIRFSLEALEVPDFDMLACWNLPQLLGYLGTWSAVREYQKQQGHSPLDEIEAQLASHWGDPQQIKTLRWPLGLRIWSNS